MPASRAIQSRNKWHKTRPGGAPAGKCGVHILFLFCQFITFFLRLCLLKFSADLALSSAFWPVLNRQSQEQSLSVSQFGILFKRHRGSTLPAKEKKLTGVSVWVLPRPTHTFQPPLLRASALLSSPSSGEGVYYMTLSSGQDGVRGETQRCPGPQVVAATVPTRMYVRLTPRVCVGQASPGAISRLHGTTYLSRPPWEHKWSPPPFFLSPTPFDLSNPH